MNPKKNFGKNFYEKIQTACDGHWIWTGPYVTEKKYPVYTYTGKKMGARKAAWILSGKTVNEGELVISICGVDYCCNPEHCRTISRKNLPRMINLHAEKRTGEKNKLAKLTENDVIFIKEHSEIKGVDLANKFNVHPSLISRIRGGRCWKHIINMTPKQ